MLYILSTPIGNLQDLSHRAVTVLKEVNQILCEDTRHSRILLDHYGIHTPLRSFHKFTEQKHQQEILAALHSGHTLALISDAGTPLIADPGASLVTACHQADIPVSVIPGPCALIAALSLSGFPTAPFQFLGFLPKAQQELRHTLLHALLYRGTTLCYEAPHRILDTLAQLQTLSPERPLCIARELTKRHEESLFGTAHELLTHFDTHPPRGEMVLLISASPDTPPTEDLPLKECVDYLVQTFALPQPEAIKLAAHITGFPKRVIYKQFIR